MNIFKKILNRIERTLNTHQAYKFFIKDWIELNDLKLCSQIVSTMRFFKKIDPLEMSVPKANKIIIIAPHTDDEILGPGGTLIKCLMLNKSVTVIYLSSGKPIVQNNKDAKEISRKLGFNSVFLDFPLGDFPITEDSISIIAQEINKVHPKAIFLPFLFDDHDDHRRASELIFNVSKVHQKLFSNIEIWGYQVYTSLPLNVVVDITDVVDKKEELIRLYRAQAKVRDWANYSIGLNAYNSRFLKTGSKKSFAENFFVVPWHEYKKICSIYFQNPSSCYYNKNYLK